MSISAFGFSALAARVRRSFPSPVLVLCGTAVWSAAIAATAYLGIAVRDWATWEKVGQIVLLYACGGAIAFPVGFFVARVLSIGRSSQTAFAAALLSFAAATVMACALVFALDYRSYYAEWHAEIGSLDWTLQFIFTTVSALYQFGVLGLRLLTPAGFLPLVLVAAWFTRLPR